MSVGSEPNAPNEPSIYVIIDRPIPTLATTRASNPAPNNPANSPSPRNIPIIESALSSGLLNSLSHVLDEVVLPCAFTLDNTKPPFRIPCCAKSVALRTPWVAQNTPLVELHI